jgi:integrase
VRSSACLDPQQAGGDFERRRTETKRLRDALVGKRAPATINRTVNVLKAALALAAAHDPRIGNARAWKISLANLPGAHRARNVILDDATIRRIIAASYARDDGFGLLIEMLATTGARFSQAARLEVSDLQADRARLNSKHISEHSDDLVPPALLSLEAPDDHKVVALATHRP